MEGFANRRPNIQLRDERTKRNWTQAKVAEALGVTDLTVGRWERGETTPPPYYRKKLCDLFEVTPEALGIARKAPKKVLATVDEPHQPSEALSSSLGESACSQEQEVSISRPAQESNAVLPSSESVSEDRTLQPLLKSSANRPSRRLSLHHIPAWWWLLLSLFLVLALMTSVFLWPGSIPKATSGAGVSLTARGGTITPPSDDAVPAAYGARGHLILNDSLSDERTQEAWHTSNPNKSMGCHFRGGAYNMKEDAQNYCLADRTDFENFVYQIEMTALQGQMGGIIFRVNDAQQFYYNFQVSVDGHYFLYRSNPTPNSSDLAIASGQSAAIVQGYHHPNVLAVKAIGEDLFLYSNFRLVAHVQDRSYTHGNVGVAIVVSNEQGETEMTFRNAKVWTI